MKKQERTRRRFSVWKGVLCAVGGAAALTLIVLCAVICIAAYGMTHPEKQAVDRFPDEIGLYHEVYEIAAPSGATMLAWFIPAQPRNTADLNQASDATPSSKTVVFSHSYKDNKVMPLLNILYLARDLADAGYNAVLFDYSGSGSSTGGGYTFGAREKDELRCVLDFFEREKGFDRFALAGWSFGAASALTEGADDARVCAVIADSPYADLRQTFSHDFSRWSGLPEALTPFVRFAAERFAGADLYADSPLAACARMRDKTVLLIRGDSDKIFGDDAKTLLAALGESVRADLWEVANCGHMAAWTVEEENYKNRVIDTLDAAFEVSGSEPASVFTG